MQHDIPDWLRYTAMAIWLLAGVPGAVELVNGTPEAGPTWIAPYLVFGGALLVTLRRSRHAPSLTERAGRTCALILLGSLIAVMVLGGCASTGLLLPISAWQLASRFSIGAVLTGIGIQTALALWLICPPLGFDQGLFMVPALVGAQLLAAFAILVARRERASRHALETVNEQLIRTQDLQSERARLAERNRISGELHDVVGHSLTALSIQLEVASHLSAGAALDHVKRSQSLARNLLAQVRNVVGRLRGDSRITFETALWQLINQVPQLAVACTIDDGARNLPEPQRSVVLRCVQEIITNTLRHARAQSLVISVRQISGALQLEADDDGAGAEAIRFGHGLELLHERIESLGGEVSVRSTLGGGFHMMARVPYAA